MAATSRADAVKAFIRPVQAALSCFATAKITADTYDPGPIGILAVNSQNLVRLRGPGKVRLTAAIHYEILATETNLGSWRVSTRGWIHHLYTSDNADIVGYHWHPREPGHATWPHLHVQGGKDHLPTGRVMIEDILQLAMEFGATPTDPEKWASVCKRNRQRFAASASWGIPAPGTTATSSP
jgi:hypothetical protein